MSGRFEIAFVLIFVACAQPGGAQERRPPTEIPFQLVSAVETQFDPPRVLGRGDVELTYAKAIVVSLRVSDRDLSSVAPSLQPYLYIGRREYPVMEQTRLDEPGAYVLEFHVRDWAELPVRSPMVLTVDRGAPAREAGLRRLRAAGLPNVWLDKGILRALP